AGAGRRRRRPAA
ncbi:hypothetical protein CFC21_051646, partial [Triticum aestivum]